MLSSTAKGSKKKEEGKSGSLYSRYYTLLLVRDGKFHLKSGTGNDPLPPPVTGQSPTFSSFFYCSPKYLYLQEEALDNTLAGSDISDKTEATYFCPKNNSFRPRALKTVAFFH